MALTLTESEWLLAEKMIRRLEKRARGWRWGRFFMLFSGACSFGLGAWSWSVASGSAKELGSPIVGATKELTLDYLAFSVWSRSMDALIFSSTYLQAEVCVLLGTLLVVYALGNWRRDLRDALIAKVLRAELQGLTGSE